MKETEVFTGQQAGQDLRDILAEGRDWVVRHPVAAKRAYDLINSSRFQPPEKWPRIFDLALKLYSRP